MMDREFRVDFDDAVILQGPPGKDGEPGAPGKDGKDGAPGKDGAAGASAYDAAVAGGYTGTEDVFNRELSRAAGQALLVDEHLFSGQNPHGVTARQVGALPAVLDDDKEETYISTARTIRMGSTGENYNDDAQGERGLGEFSVTENYVGMAVRKDSTDETRRYLRLYDSNTYPDVSKAARLIDEDGKQHTLFGTHNPVVKRLWVNDTPTEEFAAGSMPVPGLANELVTAYDVIAIVFNATVEGEGRTVCFFHKGEQKVAAAVPGGGYLCERLVSLNDGELYFGNGRYYKAYGATGRTNNNNYAIPLAVYKIQCRV